MTIPAIIAFCTLLLISYFFHLTAAKTRIPSVILLLLLGWLLRQGTVFFEIQMPNLKGALPILGTIGLILIVLEGSLELEMSRKKFRIMGKSFLGALLPMLALAFGLAYMFEVVGHFNFHDSLLNAIPFCIISSAIAIPSVQGLKSSLQEFVIYESSLSDILGVIFFNFIAFNEVFDGASFAHFGIQLLIVISISFVATIGLSFLLSKIENHIKFVPIIVLVILIYAISKFYHLPALIFILMFGLFIGNFNKLKRFKWIERFKPDVLTREVKRFGELTIEAAFLVRSLFFLLFGYLIETEELLNTDTLLWAIGIVLIIYLLRFFQLVLSRLPIMPLLFVSPRGLITILLFLSIPTMDNIELVNNSLILQVILISTLLMMFGFMFTKKEKPEQIPFPHKDEIIPIIDDPEESNNLIT